MKPSFIGIGAQKCATSWVYRVLEDHPEAVLSEPKELHFFSSYFDHGYQWYEQHFRGRAGTTVTGEFSTTYLYNADAAARARAYNPHFRIIVSLRDPVARAYSNHLHEVRAGHITAADLTYEACEADNPMYLQQSRYAEQLKKWLRCFPAEQIFVLFQEEISADPAIQAAKLYRFLGIDPEHSSPYLHERVNVSAVDRSGVARGVLRTAAAALRGVGGQRFVRDLRTSPLVKRLREANKRSLAEVIPKLQPSTEVRLIGELSDDMRELAQLLERQDLPWPSWQRMQSR
jgi:hypothetical protein